MATMIEFGGVECTDAARTIALHWAGQLGAGWHPDNRGADYAEYLDADEQAQYDDDMSVLFDESEDAYAVGMAAWVELGIFTRGELS